MPSSDFFLEARLAFVLPSVSSPGDATAAAAAAFLPLPRPPLEGVVTSVTAGGVDAGLAADGDMTAFGSEFIWYPYGPMRFALIGDWPRKIQKGRLKY